ncbi:hypothetical protein CSC43_6948 [Pseudomonas aeruginosa]|nr:hypothetical protein CSC43_6948 [Pseudomonas aeruginosa]
MEISKIRASWPMVSISGSCCGIPADYGLPLGQGQGVCAGVHFL